MLPAAHGSDIATACPSAITVRNSVIQVGLPGRLTASRGSASLIPGYDEFAQPIRRPVVCLSLVMAAACDWHSSRDSGRTARSSFVLRPRDGLARSTNGCGQYFLEAARSAWLDRGRRRLRLAIYQVQGQREGNPAHQPGSATVQAGAEAGARPIRGMVSPRNASMGVVKCFGPTSRRESWLQVAECSARRGLAGGDDGGWRLGGHSSSRQSLQRMMVPAGYSMSVSPSRVKPAFRQIVFDAG
jgi:hypothetical protein